MLNKGLQLKLPVVVKLLDCLHRALVGKVGVVVMAACSLVAVAVVMAVGQDQFLSITTATSPLLSTTLTTFLVQKLAVLQLLLSQLVDKVVILEVGAF